MEVDLNIINYMERPVTLRELYHAAEAKGMLDASITVVGDTDWGIDVKNFKITDTEIRIW